MSKRASFASGNSKYISGEEFSSTSNELSSMSASGGAANFENFLKTKLHKSLSIIFENSFSWKSILDFFVINSLVCMKFQFQLVTTKFHKNFDIFLNHNVVNLCYNFDRKLSLSLSNTAGPRSQLQTTITRCHFRPSSIKKEVSARECKDICSLLVAEMVKELYNYFGKFRPQLRDDDWIKEIHFRGMEMDKKIVDSFTNNVFPTWKFTEGQLPKIGHPKHSAQLFPNILFLDENGDDSSNSNKFDYFGSSVSSSSSSSSNSSFSSSSSSTSLVSSMPSSREAVNTFIIRNMVMDFDLPPTCSLLAKVKYESDSTMDSLVSTSFSQFLFTLGSFVNMRLIAEFGLWKFCGKSSIICSDSTKRYISTSVLKIPSRKFKMDLPWGDIADYSPSHLGKLLCIEDETTMVNNNKIVILFSGSKGIHVWIKDRFSSLVHFSTSAGEPSAFTKIFGNGLEIHTILSLLLIYIDNNMTGRIETTCHILEEWKVVNFIVTKMENLDFYKAITTEEKYVKVTHETFQRYLTKKAPKRIGHDCTLQNILDNFLVALYSYDNNRAFVNVDDLDKAETVLSSGISLYGLIEQEVIPMVVNLISPVSLSDDQPNHSITKSLMTQFVLFTILFNPLITMDVDVNDKKRLIRMPLSPNPKTNINSFTVNISKIFGEVNLDEDGNSPEYDVVYSRFKSLITNNQFC